MRTKYFNGVRLLWVIEPSVVYTSRSNKFLCPFPLLRKKFQKYWPRILIEVKFPITFFTIFMTLTIVSVKSSTDYIFLDKIFLFMFEKPMLGFVKKKKVKTKKVSEATLLILKLSLYFVRCLKCISQISRTKTYGANLRLGLFPVAEKVTF